MPDVTFKDKPTRVPDGSEFVIGTYEVSPGVFADVKIQIRNVGNVPDGKRYAITTNQAINWATVTLPNANTMVHLWLDLFVEATGYARSYHYAVQRKASGNLVLSLLDKVEYGVTGAKGVLAKITADATSLDIDISSETAEAANCLNGVIDANDNVDAQIRVQAISPSAAATLAVV